MIGGDDAEPRGICGSGLIDIVAQLRLAGLLDDGGKMMSREEAEDAGHPLADRLVMREDVKAFHLYGDVVLTQAGRARAAVRQGRDLDGDRDRDARARPRVRPTSTR